MMTRKHLFTPHLRCFPLLLGGLLTLATAGRAQLVHQNSTFSFTGNPSGAFTWTIDGVDQLAQQSLYYRIGSGAESPLHAIGAPTINVVDPRTLNVVYANATFSVTLSYLLTGQTFGTGNSGLNTTVTVENLSNGSLDFHLFQYTDFNLGGSGTTDSVTFYKSLGKFQRAVQRSGDLWMTNSFVSGFFPPTDVEAALYDSTLQSLTDLNQTTLSGATNAGPGDVTYTIRWNAVLNAAGQANDTLQVNETTSLHVPEPSGVALFACGVAGLLMLRRWRMGRG